MVFDLRLFDSNLALVMYICTPTMVFGAIGFWQLRRGNRWHFYAFSAGLFLTGVFHQYVVGMSYNNPGYMSPAGHLFAPFFSTASYLAAWLGGWITTRFAIPSVIATYQRNPVIVGSVFAGICIAATASLVIALRPPSPVSLSVINDAEEPVFVYVITRTESHVLEYIEPQQSKRVAVELAENLHLICEFEGGLVESEYFQFDPGTSLEARISSNAVSFRVLAK